MNDNNKMGRVFQPLTIAQWRALDPAQQEARLRSAPPGDPAWIIPPGVFPARRPSSDGPLAGLPFAVKDNIDAEGVATTAGCPEFAYRAQGDSAAVERLVQAGAHPAGKTNLDQFATGLVGTRSPFGIVPNVHNAAFVGGGSSSGSASVVARGLVPFSLGTDTAGSGRVPAGLQGIVGLKPTKGWISTRGVVPACRSLDCVSVFAASVDDAALVSSVLAGPDSRDPYSRPRPSTATYRLRTRRLAVPSTLDWFGDALQEKAWNEALARWRAMGYALVAIDPAPLFEMASLLYEGPWVAERVAGLGGFFPARADAIHPVVRTILEGAGRFDAASVYRAEVKRRELEARIAQLWAGCDALLVPTTPRVYTVEQVLADPLGTNAKLGTWTNFVNLADLCALAVPAGMREDQLPFGVTLIGRPWEDDHLVALGREWEGWADEVLVVAVGAHMTGLPLNHLLTRRGARLVGATKTLSTYKLFALDDQTPPKPGLLRVGEGGGSLEVEVWAIPRVAYGAFVAEIPSPLGIGTVELEDGRRVQGFLCEAAATVGRRDITALGGWRAYLATRSS